MESRKIWQDMTLHEWLIQAEKQTEDASWLATKALGRDRAWIAANHRMSLKPAQKAALDRLLKRRLADEPLAYILGTQPFYGRDFIVTKNTLIPRPETEDMVTEALKTKADVYVDIGTGSGAMAVTLAAETKAQIFASEVSSKALVVAKNNANTLAPKRVTFFRGSLFHAKLKQALKGKKKITIVANLPYLPPHDKKIMPKSVTKYEPHSALFAKDDGMELNKKLLKQLPKNVNIFIEIDPPQSKKLSAFAKSLFPSAKIKVIRDRCGRERILRILV